jgi:hypothetical protein
MTTEAPRIGMTNAQIGQALNPDQLPAYFLSPGDREKLKASRAGLRLTSTVLTTTDDFRKSAKRLYSPYSTTNMSYGLWFVPPP